MLRGIAGVVAGYLLFAVAVTGLFYLTGHEPHDPAGLGFRLGSTFYGMVFAGLGGFLASAIAGRNDLRVARILALVIALGALVSIFTRPEGGTISGQILAIFLVAPCAALGGRRYLRRHWRRSPAAAPAASAEPGA